jgi:glutathionyl-hydroquinone reductase
MTSVIEGAYEREDSRFRRWVTAEASAEFPAATGRYHLYVALACPWSHRAVILRHIKGLQDAISISYVDPYRDERGWAFSGGRYVDDVNGFDFLAEAYEQTQAGYDGNISVPVLWDKQTGQVVSNESADVVRMLGSAFDALAGEPGLDLYPAPLREEIDSLNERIYATVNNGVYRAGFSKSQAAYEDAFEHLFATLADLERLLSQRRYLAGDEITEADWRLFPTLVRFDTVYYLHFRCNGRRILDHPNLWGYARELHQHPGIAETVAMDEIKRHYYTTHDELNPKRIIPAGPLDLDWDAPHGRV